MIPALAIGGLSIALVAGLEALGQLARFNGWIADSVSRGGLEIYAHQFPVWCSWMAVLVFPVALSFAMLSTPGNPKRAILWITTLFLLGSWAPVLSLASTSIDIAGPWVATLWAGFCSIVYASKHRMPADAGPAPKQP